MTSMGANFRIQSFTSVDEALLDSLVRLEAEIFDEPFSRDVLSRELTGRLRLVALIAYEGERLCGFKVGYERTSDTFYSYIGGVVPEFRGRGIARLLLEEQHRLAREMGFTSVRTHTKNSFRDMLVLNIRCGFKIVGIQHREGERELKVILEKKL